MGREIGGSHYYGISSRHLRRSTRTPQLNSTQLNCKMLHGTFFKKHLTLFHISQRLLHSFLFSVQIKIAKALAIKTALSSNMDEAF